LTRWLRDHFDRAAKGQSPPSRGGIQEAITPRGRASKAPDTLTFWLAGQIRGSGDGAGGRLLAGIEAAKAGPSPSLQRHN